MMVVECSVASTKYQNKIYTVMKEPEPENSNQLNILFNKTKCQPILDTHKDEEPRTKNQG